MLLGLTMQVVLSAYVRGVQRYAVRLARRVVVAIAPDNLEGVCSDVYSQQQYKGQAEKYQCFYETSHRLRLLELEVHELAACRSLDKYGKEQDVVDEPSCPTLLRQSAVAPFSPEHEGYKE